MWYAIASKSFIYYPFCTSIYGYVFELSWLSVNYKFSFERSATVCKKLDLMLNFDW
jgi:hypothetical protein